MGRFDTGRNIIPFSMHDLSRKQPFVFIRLRSIAFIEGSITKRPVTNRRPIVAIRSFTSE